MQYDTQLAAEYARAKLESLCDRAHRDTVELTDKADIPPLVTHYAALRREYDALEARLDQVKAEINDLSQNIIPSVFASQDVQTIKILDVGRVTVNTRWTASMPDKPLGMQWLKSTGNGGLVIETVNAMTLAAFAKQRALDGEPLPDNLFNIGTAQTTSITKG